MHFYLRSVIEKRGKLNAIFVYEVKQVLKHRVMKWNWLYKDSSIVCVENLF